MTSRTYTAADVRQYLTDRIQALGISMRQWARTNGLSAAYVSDVMRGNRVAGPTICAVLGFERTRVPEQYVYHKRKRPARNAR
jgi:gp16 family phage-associated protein